MLMACYNPNVTPVVKNVPNENNDSPEFTYKIYPNPVKNEVYLNYDIPVNSNVKINILNLAGNKVKNVLTSKQESGSYSVSANIEGFANGAYILEMQVNDKVYTEIIVKK